MAAPSTPSSRHVLITGANRGVGLALLRALRARGATAYGAARDPGQAHAETGLEFLPLDVCSDESCAGLPSLLGHRPLDLLVNNAGMGDGGGSLEALDTAEAMRVYDANALGPLRVTRALLPNLAAASGMVVHISSDLGSIGAVQGGGSYAYRMSKAALNMASRVLATELAPRGIRSVALHPGSVRTRMGGEGAELSAGEAAEVLADCLEALSSSDTGRFVDPKGRDLPF